MDGSLGVTKVFWKGLCCYSDDVSSILEVMILPLAIKDLRRSSCTLDQITFLDIVERNCEHVVGIVLDFWRWRLFHCGVQALVN